MKSIISHQIPPGAVRRLAVLLAVLVSGCAGVPVHTGAEVVPVQWIVHETQHSLNVACGYNPTRIQSTASMRAVRTSARFAKVNGCFKQPIPGGLCTIHTRKMPHAEHISAEASDFFETLGHESAHCFVGRFHR